MYKKFVWIGAVSFSLLLGTQTAFAHSDWCDDRMDKMAETLKLDAAQKEKMKPVWEQLKSSMKEKGTQMKELHTQINTQMDSDKVDQSAVDGLIDKKAALLGDMMKAKAAARQQLFTVLNPKQKAAFKDKLKKMHEKISAKFAECDKK